MSTWEDQFKNWAQGPSDEEKAKCENAETAIKRAIAKSSALSRLSLRVFTQGSYASNTNVRLDSDVDVCVCLTQNFFYDLSQSPSQNPADFNIAPGTIAFADFKLLVGQALVAEFEASAVQRGNKAFDVHANTYRVDADVAPAFEHRRYLGLNTFGTPMFESGIEIHSDKGQRLINWPQQTHDNGIAKNERTGRRYKRVIRILKRLRNVMQEHDVSAAKDLPSFLIECLVWNVPESSFSYATYTDMVQAVLAHAFDGTQNQMSCNEWGEVNELMYLFRDGNKPWTRAQAHSFTAAAWGYLGFQ